MAKFLVIVESPAKAKTIQRILGRDYMVTASMGHVRDLSSEKIGKGKDALSGVDVTNDFEPRYDVLSNKAKTVKDIIKQSERVDTIFLCPDPDREGEAIAFHLRELMIDAGRDPGDFKRVTYHEITPRAINEAFRHPRDLDMNLVNSQQARRILDRVVGYKLSPLLWKKIKRGLSAGRVQSVAVRLVSEREKEIMAFIPREYHTVAGKFSTSEGFPAQLKFLDDKKVVCSAADLDRFDSKPKEYVHVANESEAKSIASKALALGTYVVSSYEEKQVKERPYPPFSTSNLQVAAAVRLGYDAKRTMSIAQQLYEGVGGSDHGLITYMRTDSFNVGKDAQDEARDFIKGKYGDDHYPAAPNVYASKKGAQEAHECIRPTEVSLTPDDAKSKLSDEQYKLYRLIWQRFVASQMAPAVYDAVACELEPEGQKPGVMTFRATGRKIAFAGWTAVYERDEDENASLPAMAVGQKVKTTSILPEKHVTEPPPRFTDATLVKLLEKEGIGRPSTYASIIAVIQDRGYVEKAGFGGRAPFKATTLGMLVTDSLVGHFPVIMDVGFTRDMEERLDDVSEGKVGHVKVLKDFYKEFMTELAKADIAMPTKKGGEVTTHPCPKCSEMMVKFLGRFGEFLACPKCKTKQNLDSDGNPKDPDADILPITCDKCGSKMMRAKGRFGEYIKCSAEGCKFTMGLTKAGMPKRKLAAEPTKLACPKCSKPMVVRISARGKMPKPKPFCSCSGFPKCRHAEELPADLKSVGEEVVKQWSALRELDRRDQALMRVEE